MLNFDQAKNNKGSTILIVSLVVGVLFLSVGGYFGYKWYQDKLLKERITKIENIKDALSDTKKSLDATTNSDFQPTLSGISNVKSLNKKLQDSGENLGKLEADEKIKSDVKKCVEDIKGLTQNATLILDTAEMKINGRQITQNMIEDVQAAQRRIDNYNKLKSCDDATKTVNDLLDELQK